MSLLLKTPMVGGSHKWPAAFSPFLLSLCDRQNSKNDLSDPHPYIIPSLVCAEPINMMKYHSTNRVSKFNKIQRDLVDVIMVTNSLT